MKILNDIRLALYATMKIGEYPQRQGSVDKTAETQEKCG